MLVKPKYRDGGNGYQVTVPEVLDFSVDEFEK